MRLCRVVVAPVCIAGAMTCLATRTRTRPCALAETREEVGWVQGAGAAKKAEAAKSAPSLVSPPPLFFVLQSPCLSSEATGFRRFSVCGVEATISTSDWCPCLCEIESPTVRGSEAASSQNTVCRRHGIEEMKRGEAGTIRGSQV